MKITRHRRHIQNLSAFSLGEELVVGGKRWMAKYQVCQSVSLVRHEENLLLTVITVIGHLRYLDTFNFISFLLP